MKSFRYIFSLLAGLGIAFSIWSFVVTDTIFSSDYTLERASESQVYQPLATSLPNLIAELGPMSLRDRAVLRSVITPSLVKGTVEDVVPQLERYYRKGGDQPMLNLPDLSAEVDNLGLNLSPTISQTISQPVTVSAGRLDPLISQIVNSSQDGRYIGFISAIVLLGIAFLLFPHYRIRVVAQSMVFASVFVLVATAIVWLAPRLLVSAATTSVAKPLAPSLTIWLEAIVAGPIQTLLIAAGTLIVLAILTYILAFITKMSRGFRHHGSHER